MAASCIELSKVRQKHSNALPMQEGPGAATLTTKQLATSVTEKRTNQKQGVKRFSCFCKSAHGCQSYNCIDDEQSVQE